LTSAAANAADFDGLRRCLRIQRTIPGASFRTTVTIQINGDATVEPDENFTLTLQTFSNNAEQVSHPFGAQQRQRIIQKTMPRLRNVIEGIRALRAAVASFPPIS
jgi:hypothetical protein